MSKQIGYIKRGIPVLASVCLDHGIPDVDVPLYKVNVWPYGANCFECGSSMLEGAPGWCNLYEPAKEGNNE